MRHSSWLKTTAINLLMLILGALPLFLLLSGIFARAAGWESPGDIVGTASVLLPAMVGPMLLGGVVYVVCLNVALARTQRSSRVLAVALTPLVTSGFLLLGMRPLIGMKHMLLALIVALVLYGFVVRLPAERRSGG